MGIGAKWGSLPLFQRAVALCLATPGGKMAELGNQHVMKSRHNGPSKRVCESLSIPHVSFDINGQDGALPFDLTKPLPEEFQGFTAVTNFGTSEHCNPDQGQVFANIHNLCGRGGMMFHNVPRAGSCKGHGDWKYSTEFFTQLAYANRYRIHDVLRVSVGRWEFYVTAVLEKTIDAPFNLDGFIQPDRE